MKRAENLNDTQTGMLLGIPRSARCVQRFDGSLDSAIHITYRVSLRSSSMREPRDPLLKVVLSQPTRAGNKDIQINFKVCVIKTFIRTRRAHVLLDQQQTHSKKIQ